jgi:queuine tRNA-ribosyltransferase/7-cyano-7-deazaguanine tRNA-ribosyltransferase
MRFEILKKSRKSRARLGLLKTAGGEVETPALVTVATQAAVKTLTSEQAAQAGSRMLICNTLHLHLKPGEKVVRKSGGLHKFMNWPGPLMTDSGGYQVFSLGFGMDHGVGKVLKEKISARVRRDQQPRLLRINDDGVLFTSYVDGRRVFIGPKESIRIQEALGADIIFAFDECTSPVADRAYTADSLKRTHRWAKTCLDVKRSKQALFGVIQGGRYEALRRQSARYISRLPFDGFGIGGEFGGDKSVMAKMIGWVIDDLPAERPRHLLGIGHPEDIVPIIRAGVDTFDCTMPTHYARHGTAFTSAGRLDLNQSRYLQDQQPLDKKCSCSVCARHSRSYICHLFRAKEVTAMSLLTSHNLHFFNEMVRRVRQDIKRGRI